MKKVVSRKAEWRTDDLRQDEIPSPINIRPIRASDLYDSKRIREENLARLHHLCGGEPPTPADWSWADRMRGGPADERTPWQRTAGKT